LGFYIFSDCLKDQVVWVTGASYGIGAACALEASKHGAKVVISARSEQQLQDVKRKCLGKFPTGQILSNRYIIVIYLMTF
jgi:dehydrogenase/reductase SDR family protein 7